MRTTLLAVSLVLCLPNFAFAEEEWELKRDRDGIQVYTRSVEGSKHKAVKAEMVVEAGLNELVGLVMDTSACPDWAALCKTSEVTEQVSETELYVYTLNDLPWPVKDRDAVAKVMWTQEESGSVRMTAELVTGKVPEIKKALRLTTGITSWVFYPDENGTRIVSEAHLDPGGGTPAWLTNMLLVDSPFDTMVGMRNLVSSGKYKDAEFAFISAD